MLGFDDETRGERHASRQALLASLLLHLLVLAALMIGIPRFSRDQPLTASLPVEILTEEDLLSEQMARADIEALEEAQSEPLAESEVEEPTAETPAETAAAAQPPRASMSDAPQPAEAVARDAPAEAQAAPVLTPAVSEDQVEERPETAAEAVTADLAEAVQSAPAVEASQQAQAASDPEEPEAEAVEAPEADLAEAALPADATSAEEIEAAEPQQVTAKEEEPLPAMPPAPRPRPRERQRAEAPQEKSEPETGTSNPPAEDADAEDEGDLLASILRNVEQLEQQERQQATAPRAAETDKAPRDRAEVQRRAAQLGDMIREQVAQCWRIDGGRQEARSLRIPIRVRLARDGRLVDNPEIQEPTRYGNDSYYRSAADAAVRAVLRCAPLDLPAQDYDIWRDLVLNFDPREMF